MRLLLGACVVMVLLLGSGCTRHLVFLESSHLGLKASFEPNNPAPAEVDLGWRRAMFAMVPQKSQNGRGASEGQPPPSGSVKVERINHHRGTGSR